MLGVDWVLLYSVRDLILGGHGAFLRKRHKKVWLAAPLCLFWTLWTERNWFVFAKEEFLILRMRSFFVYSLWSWSRMFIPYDSLFVSFFMQCIRG